tara:strand:+ start:831 stop:1055 length:225 start_codon:yes stop_codon:yes gene_type:complete
MPKVAIIRNNFYFDDILNNNLPINPSKYDLNNQIYLENTNKISEFEENFFDFNLIKSKNNNLNSKKNIRNLFKI